MEFLIVFGGKPLGEGHAEGRDKTAVEHIAADIWCSLTRDAARNVCATFGLSNEEVVFETDVVGEIKHQFVEFAAEREIRVFVGFCLSYQ